MSSYIQTCPSCGRHVAEELAGRSCSHCRIAEEVVKIMSYPILSGGRSVMIEYRPPSRILAAAVRGAALVSHLL
jgi:hypothetical protein